MSHADALLLFVVILVGYLSLGVVILAAVHRIDRQHRERQRDLSTVQRQLSAIHRSASYLEGLARVARNEVEELEAEDLQETERRW